MGTLVSGSSPVRVISTATLSKTLAPAASRMALLTLSRWLPLPSGSRAARKGYALIIPSTIAISREGSFALAFLGSVRRVHDLFFSFAVGRHSLAPKRIVDLIACGLGCFMSRIHRAASFSDARDVRCPRWQMIEHKAGFLDVDRNGRDEPILDDQCDPLIEVNVCAVDGYCRN